MNLSRRGLLAGLLAIPFGLRCGPAVAVTTTGPTTTGPTTTGPTTTVKPPYEPETKMVTAYIVLDMSWERRVIGPTEMGFFTKTPKGVWRELHSVEYTFGLLVISPQTPMVESVVGAYTNGIQRHMGLNGVVTKSTPNFLVTVGHTYDECVALEAEGRYFPTKPQLFA